MTDPNPVGKIRQRGAEAAKRTALADPPTLAEQLNDPDGPIVQEAETRRCDICGTSKGQPCTPRAGLRDDLKNRLIHLGRIANPAAATHPKGNQ